MPETEITANTLVMLKLAELMKKTKTSRTTLANRAGIPRSTVYSLFNGKCRNIGINTLYLICFYGLGMTLEDFFGTINFNETE